MKKQMLLLSVLLSTTLMASASDLKGSINARNLAVKDLTAAAKITSNQAATAATNAVQGNIVSISLEKEDGYLVYAVEVVNPSTGLNEINVDAGDGRILAKEVKNEHLGTDSTENDSEEND
jgi:uncharacterized membrane protein YkoI